VSLGRGQGQAAGVGAAGEQAVGDFLLLLDREQDVGVDADRQCAQPTVLGRRPLCAIAPRLDVA
jgi:hypothetical protein